MRIIAGRLKGRRLRAPVGPGVRPTSDRLRETLFNVLRDRMDGARVLDAFAGTGAVGLEAISRGASHVTFVEADRRAAAALCANIDACGAAQGSRVIQDTLHRAATRGAAVLGPFDVIFLDPPYDFADLDGGLADAGRLLAPEGVVVLEHSRRRGAPAAAASLIRQRTLEAGDSALTLYALGGSADTMEVSVPR
ncbi:MAG: 16S rRNA (guanine(966)-N(2))-methyltransferase RsmD [Acidobacteria bacterium]|nr:16S rRNA (guanine(966)-N(2))-methyltransferase RsmD [Acidobacteriota bacterium]